MRNSEYVILTVVSVVVCVGSVFVGAIQGSNDSYKQGQIDAINGKIQYHLVTMPDSTKEWEKISK